jgi:hypothetical protein
MNTGKRCGFILPRPFIILSNKALKRNGYRKYIIYPDLSRFKGACQSCRYRRVKGKRSSCALGDRDFMLKFYGIDKSAGNGVLVSLGSVPGEIRARAIGSEARAYLDHHSRKRNGGRSNLSKKQAV